MNLQPSRYNLIGQIRNGDTWYVINPLSGHADLIDADEAQALRDNRLADPEAFAERGYLVDPEQEQRDYRKAYLNFVERRETDEVQLLFAVTYACNFACTYCFQESYAEQVNRFDGDVVGAFFQHIDTQFAGRSKYLTLFGGEPLLPAPSVRVGVEALLRGAAERGVEVAIVTNGYNLVKSLDLLELATIREVQVTLDGPREIHDARRPLRGGQGTFDDVVAGIDAVLAKGIPVNLRAVIDRDNLPHLAGLSRFAIAKGWTSNPNFKTQLGRNYELHTCQASRSRLYSRLEMYSDLADEIDVHPEILEFHKPSYHLARFLVESDAVPEPLFDACPGCKTEWAFDAHGRIFPCTANVGKPGEAIGTYWPESKLDVDQVGHWEDRDVLSMSSCKECALAMVCGGGCAEVARNATGDLHAPDCRPVNELVNLGMNVYFKEQNHV